MSLLHKFGLAKYSEIEEVKKKYIEQISLNQKYYADVIAEQNNRIKKLEEKNTGLKEKIDELKIEIADLKSDRWKVIKLPAEKYCSRAEMKARSSSKASRIVKSIHEK